jgi:hypothetical protein
MSLLSVVKNVARAAGFEPPLTVVTNTDSTVSQVLYFVQRAGEEIARRGDWRNLRANTYFTSSATYPLPAGFHRLVPGGAVRFAGDLEPMRGSLSPDEWRAMVTAGTSARVFYRLSGSSIEFSRQIGPFEIVTLDYMTDTWVQSGSTRLPSIATDADTFVFPERLLELNALVRWKRQKGLPYKDEEAEFEAELASELVADRGIRIEAGKAA